MAPSATNLVVEHLIAGVVALYAFFILLPEQNASILAINYLPQPVTILIFLSFAYIVGVVLSHASARLLEHTESKIYLKVLRNVSPYSGIQLKEALNSHGYEFKVSETSVECDVKDAEKIFGIMRYSLLGSGNYNDRILYYQTMIRVCRNFSIPLLMDSAAILYSSIVDNKGPLYFGLFISLVLLLLAAASFYTAKGYTEWLGYATVRSFVDDRKGL